MDEALKFKNLSILIVDDIGSIRSVLREMLNKIGFGKVTEAESGEEALLLIEEGNEKFDIVMTDWSLPQMSGTDLLRAIRNDPGTRTLPVLMATAKASPNELSEAINSGVNDYLVKPFNINQLREKLTRVIIKNS